MTSSRRSRTGAQTIFKLSHPQPVIYDFTDLSDGLKITIPPDSSWICRAHWHETVSACETISPIEGPYIIFHSSVMTHGSGIVSGGGRNPATLVMPLEPGQLVRWHRKTWWGEKGAVVFLLQAKDQVYNFHRQLCSVNQDAEAYFQLPSTPLWLRILYTLLGWVPCLGPCMKAWLVETVLWIQQRVIYSKNDYFEIEGKIPYTWPWKQLPVPAHPPKKWKEREFTSRVTISRSVLKVCHLVGTGFLGMKVSYEEYEAAGTASVA